VEFSPLELARRIEAAEALSDRESAEAFAGLEPQPLPAWEKIAGGIAAFAGAGSPLSQAHGLGLEEMADEAAVLRLENFYRERGTPAQVEVASPLDPDWPRLLGSRGFHPADETDVLIRPLAPDDTFAPPPFAVSVQRAKPGNARLWSRLLARGFGAPPELLPEMEKISMILFRRASAASYFASVVNDDEGGAAAAGAVACHGGVALLSSSSTLPEFRGRGLHTALLNARLAYAQGAGCDLATLATQAGSGSQRNALKLGFKIVYQRRMWVKAFYPNVS
jgi:GNAT superfamily N-acetyltransferase